MTWHLDKIRMSVDDPLVAFCWENDIDISDMVEVVDVPESEMDS